MSRENFQQMVGSLVKSIDDNEKIATPILAAKLANAVNAYPGDQTLGAMSRVIGKMSANKTNFITRAQLKGLYEKLYSRNTKFAELFQYELGKVEELKGATRIEHDESFDVKPYQGDEVLANALQGVFDKNLPVKMYSQTLADQAKFSVARTLDIWNLKPSALTIDDGNEQFIIIRADYDTPKGLTSFYVPVETNKNSVKDASVFLANAGPQGLNHATVKSYLTSHTGQKLTVQASNLLQVLTNAVAEHRDVSGAEMALIKLNAKRQGTSDFFQNQIVGQKIATAAVSDVTVPKSNEFASFEEQFTSAMGKAEFQFGQVVKTGRDYLVRELTGYGHKNPQVSVCKTEEKTIIYSVALDGGRVGFNVPVKIEGKKIVKPSFMLCNGKISSFNQEGINQLYVNNSSDFQAAAVASPQFSLSPADLLNNIRKALAAGNHPQAEDALNVLASMGDEKAYGIGFQLFMQGLNGVVKEASSCSMMIKNSTSEHPICGHTGLPAHKVYQDKDGNCRPLYRRGMEETYQPAIFNNSKIFG